MEKTSLEDMSYKELVRRLITQVDQTNECFKALDAREIILQKQTERMQVTLDHKTEKADFDTLVQKMDDFIISIHDEKENRQTNRKEWQWVAGIIVTALIFAGTQLLQRWPW